MKETTSTSSNYVNTVYFERLRDAVDDIYKRTSGTAFNRGFTSINQNDLYRKCAIALLEEGFIKNFGTHNEPSYVWIGAELSESVYHRVYKHIREINKKYYVAKQSKKEASNNSVEEKKPEIINTLVEEVNPVTHISVFSDQELWQELKKRGYVIKDTKLVKVEYSYLD